MIVLPYLSSIQRMPVQHAAPVLTNERTLAPVRVMSHPRDFSTSVAKVVSFLFFFSLFFDRPGNVYVFYGAFVAYSLASITLNLGYFTRIRLPPLIYGYAVFCLWAGASTFWSVDGEASWTMTRRILIVLFLLCITYVNLKRHATQTALLAALTAGVFLNFALYFLRGESSLDLAGRFSGTLSNANSLAIVGVFAMYFMVKRYLDTRRDSLQDAGVLMVCLSICIGLIIFTASRKGAVCGLLLVFISVANVIKAKRRSAGVLVLFIAGLAVGVLASWSMLADMEVTQRLFSTVEFLQGGRSDSSMRSRYRFASEAYDLFLAHRLHGVGIDGFQAASGTGAYAHNNYAELLADVGIIGFAAYYLIYARLIRRLITGRGMFIDLGFIVTLLLMEIGFVTYYERPYWIFMLLSSESFRLRGQSSNKSSIVVPPVDVMITTRKP